MSTWNPGAPNADQSPSLFPPQCTGNWSRLQTVVGSDHQFNTSDAANDGWHNIAHMQPITNSAVNNACGQLFADDATTNGNLTYIDKANNRYTITPPTIGVAPIVAAGILVVPLTNGPCTIQYQQNISSATKSTSGGATIITIVFSTALNSDFYVTLSTAYVGSPGVNFSATVSSQNATTLQLSYPSNGIVNFKLNVICVGG